jgi:hypothetical protein
MCCWAAPRQELNLFSLGLYSTRKFAPVQFLESTTSMHPEVPCRLPLPRFPFLKGPPASLPSSEPMLVAHDQPQPRPRGSLVRQGLRNLGVWALVEFAIVPLPLIILELWPIDGEIDLSNASLLLYLAAVGFVLGFAVVVLPCAIVSAWRLKRNPPWRMHFVPYLATGVCAVAFMPMTGILWGLVVIPQAVVTPVFHFLMARHYKRSTWTEG